MDTSSVNLGTTVTLREKDGRIDRYSILGAWDGEPEKGIVSYLSALAKALMGHKPRDVTAGYGRVTLEEMLEAAEALTKGGQAKWDLMNSRSLPES